MAEAANNQLPPRISTVPGAQPAGKRPVVLHIGDPVKYNPETYAEMSTAFDIIRPASPDRQRGEFIRALKEQRWGDFDAIFRPFWGTGGEMGKWDAELIDLLPASVKIFASAGAGFDWADTKLLGEKGIVYCNSGLAAAEAVADFGTIMIMSTFRRLPYCMNAATLPSATAASDEEAARTFQACHENLPAVARNLRNHVLGLIGFGNIGQQLAFRLGSPAFGMRIAYTDVERKKPAVEEKYGATFYPTLAELMRASDCVVLCTPATTDGKPLIRSEALKAMRPGTRFVNVARGSLVDEEALADALDKGTVGAIALDVHANEPRLNRRLLRMAVDLNSKDPGRVMLTCHNAGGTVDTHIGFEELSMRNVMAVLTGKDPLTPVNLHCLKPKM